MVLAQAVLLTACVGTDNLVSDEPLLGPDARAGAADARTSDARIDPNCVPGATECTNCIDDDDDGLADGADPQCTGPADRDEGSFANAVPGDNRDVEFQDCFFDGDSGPGNDGCLVHTCCMLDTCPAEIAGSYVPSECVTTKMCENFCSPRMPPGCDCFGCCTVCDGAGCVDIYTHDLVAPNCDQDSIRDPARCPTCTPFPGCGHACSAPCVLCPGQTPADLPSQCGGVAQCPDSGATCTDSSQCTGADVCYNGCCLEL